MKYKKPKWDKPMLIVLIRSKQGETVLSLCKGSGGGPIGGKSSCKWMFDLMSCMKCNSTGGS